MPHHEHRLMPARRCHRRSRSTLALTLAVLVGFGSLGFSPAAQAATPSPATQAEIAHLLDYLGNSKCEFHRNGTWHTAADARRHLEKKRDYLLKRSLIGSAEDFIDRAASSSSMTGEKYKVRCKPNPAVPSAEWLKTELKRYRG